MFRSGESSESFVTRVPCYRRISFIFSLRIFTYLSFGVQQVRIKVWNCFFFVIGVFSFFFFFLRDFLRYGIRGYCMVWYDTLGIFYEIVGKKSEEVWNCFCAFFMFDVSWMFWRDNEERDTVVVEMVCDLYISLRYKFSHIFLLFFLLWGASDASPIL